MPFDVFLCHNSTDKPAVEEIARKLQERGVEPWLDKWHLRPGDPWIPEIEKQIEAVDAAAVFLGASGSGSWHREEIQAFLQEFQTRSCRVIPVILPGSEEDSEVSLFLRNRTWVDFRGDAEEALDRLIWGITGRRPGDPAASPATRENTKRLRTLYRQRAELRSRGESTKEIDKQIRDLKRQARSRELESGEVFGKNGRYEIVEHLGHGGFAEVWRAYDGNHDDAVVALKILHSQYTRDATKRERFLRGARNMKRLDHPSIVRVLGDVPKPDEHRSGDDCFFAMEYLPGGDLRAAVRGGTLARAAALRAVLDIGDALSHAHAEGLVHRDVKPANILLTADGRAKLTDFDLVQAADTTGGTRTQGMGSFIYAPPEMMESAKTADARADVYGLAMTTAFVLHGADLPSSAMWTTDQFLAGLDAPEACREALGRALAKDAEERTATIKELCVDLRDALFTEPKPPEPIRAGEDKFGRFEVFSVHGIEQRLRWIEPTEDIVGFWMADTPCTQGLWEAVMGENPSRFKGPDRPVEKVSWGDCHRFFTALENLVPGLGARFPTEAEWEHACRAGTQTETYGELNEIAWYDGNSRGETKSVGLKAPNAWGLYDTLGNVWEWCEDQEGSYRVIRGGSWLDQAQIVRAAYRYRREPSYCWDFLGFRLARGQSALKPEADPKASGGGVPPTRGLNRRQ